ncbi:hypothetical protein [Streptomyces albus]|uniref:hypothetical protein n=1 Tax=Streptomyces albus TaxID=1888 RepID=UPI0033F96A3F
MHSDGDGGDVPLPWVLGYFACALLFWIIGAIWFIRREQSRGNDMERDEQVLAVVTAGCASALWPLAILGYGVWLLVERQIRIGAKR